MRLTGEGGSKLAAKLFGHLLGNAQRNPLSLQLQGALFRYGPVAFAP
jgi:hypothetical protein